MESKLIKYLLFAFMLHNAEEALTIELNVFLHNKFQFLIAVILFTILGFFVTFYKKYNNPQIHNYLIVGFAGMLFLNSFFPHILSAIYLKSYTPGLFTAILLILPITSIFLYKTYQKKLCSTKHFFASIFLGAISGLFLVMIFLRIGLAISEIFSL